MAAGNRHLEVGQHLDDACGSARRGRLRAHDESPEVDRMQAIGVLVGIDGQQRLLLVALRRQRQLDDEGIDACVVIEGPDRGEHLSLRDSGREMQVE